MTREVRKGANESWFRDLNERLEDRAVTRNGSDERFEIVCECAREECTERIGISVPEYEGVRTGAKSFIVVSGTPTRPLSGSSRRPAPTTWSRNSERQGSSQRLRIREMVNTSP